MAAWGSVRYAGVKEKIVKTQGCHRQLTVMAADQMEEVTVNSVSTGVICRLDTVLSRISILV